MVDYNIAASGKDEWNHQTYHDRAKVCHGWNMDLLSTDMGIVHARIRNSGMKVAVVPCKGSTFMMRCICLGGSRLEDRWSAGTAHVLEHCDFRTTDWNQFHGMDKNASTSKLFIEHQTHMLTNAQHVKTEMDFQLATINGANLKMKDLDIKLEVRNVSDEGLFNAQRGSMMRKLIMRSEALLLPRVWDGGWVAPTIGLSDGQSIQIPDSTRLKELHRQLRTPMRTTLVLAGPVDVYKTLNMLRRHFGTGVEAVNMAAAIPTTKISEESGMLGSSVSTNSGTRGLAISFAVPPYTRDSVAFAVMPYLVNVLGSQPSLKAQGVDSVSLYVNCDQNASVGSILAQVSNNTIENEEAALATAQAAIERLVILPLINFEDSGLLQKVSNGYKRYMEETLRSGPQVSAAMAIQGILSADKPSLMWHYRETLAALTPSLVRKAARMAFQPHLMAVVRATEYTGVNGHPRALQFANDRIIQRFPMTLMGRGVGVRSHVGTMPTSFDVSHIKDNNKDTLKALKLDSKGRIQSNDTNNPHIRIAFATAQPESKRTAVARLGSVQHYGGWARASMVTAALNRIAEAINAPNCKFSLTQGTVQATTVSSRAGPDIPQHMMFEPALRCMAIASALPLRGAGLARLAMVLPQAAMQLAAENAQQKYNNITFQSQALVRSKTCNNTDNGFVPASYQEALRDMAAVRHELIDLMGLVVTAKPLRIAGVNVQQANLNRFANNILSIKTAAPAISVEIFESPQESTPFDYNGQVDGLRTFPFVSAVKANRALESKGDRAALIVANQIMVGGMGSAYTHAVRQNGISYRPSGALRLSWQANPVFTLSATFDNPDLEIGVKTTDSFIRDYSTGSAEIFTKERVEQATTAIREQMELQQNQYDGILQSAISHMYDDRLTSNELLGAIVRLQNSPEQISKVVSSYFSGSSVINSIVHA